MKLNTSASSLLVLSSVVLLGSSLPFNPRNTVFERLAARATYSVVAVDGGAVPTGRESPAAQTIMETIIQTPATQTIIETDTLPFATNQIVTTKTIEGPESTDTLLVTVTSSATAATTTVYSVIDVNSPTTTGAPQTPFLSSLSTSLASSTSILSPSWSPSVGLPSAAPTKPSSVDPTPAISSSVSMVSSSSDSSTRILTTSLLRPTTTAFSSASSRHTPTTTRPRTSNTSSKSWVSSFSWTESPISSTASATALPTTKSYDNGQWHTTYPAWSITTGTL